MIYQTISATTIQRMSDGAFIPVDENNMDYRAYQAWLAADPNNTAPQYVPPPAPDVTSFIQAVKAILGGVGGANALMQHYPVIFDALRDQEWVDVSTLIQSANTQSLLTATQYSSIKSAATQYNLPLTLP